MCERSVTGKRIVCPNRNYKFCKQYARVSHHIFVSPSRGISLQCRSHVSLRFCIGWSRFILGVQAETAPVMYNNYEQSQNRNSANLELRHRRSEAAMSGDLRTHARTHMFARYPLQRIATRYHISWIISSIVCNPSG